jgi:tetratricopeptide (TPR) repeat protein
MTPTDTCNRLREREMIERYMAHRLSEAEATELETHYLTCARCQADLRLAAAIRAAPLQPVRRPVRVWSALGLAAAAGLTAFLLLSPHGQSAGLQRLGGVLEPPVYLGVAVRSATSPADSVFNVAMASYASRHYDVAIRQLEVALRTGVDSAPAEFFLAACLLMARRTEDAAAAFQRVIALGTTPYLPEAHYYLAKALIRSGHVADAIRHLRDVGAGNPGIQLQAAALADSLGSFSR